MHLASKRIAPDRNASHRSLFHCVLVLGLLVHALLPQAAAATGPHQAPPIAIHVELDVGGELESAYWLAGISSSADGAPDVLGLVWAPVSVGWFGSVWGVHLVSSKGLLPANTASEGTGTLAGLRYYTLTTVDPHPNHTYRAILSFDPMSGSVALRVEDATEGQMLVERGLKLQPYPQAIHPTPSETVAQRRVTVSERFEPVGMSWRLVHLQANGAMDPADPVDRRRPVHLHLQLPWDDLPGSLRLRVNDAEVGVFEGISHGALFRTVLDEYAAGRYEVALDYLHHGEAVSLGTRTVQVGLVEARVDAVSTHVTGPREIMFRGNLVVQADGSLSDVAIALDAVLSRVGLAPESYGTTYRFTSEHELTQRILEEHIPTLNETAVNIPFMTTVTVLSEVEWPYRVWETALVPDVRVEAGVRTVGSDGRIRLYADRPLRSGDTLRVATYNIHHGEGTDGTIDLQRLADVIAYTSADIVGLQEVDVRTRRSMGVDQLAVLAQLLRMEYAFGPNLAYQGGDYGNALLSRYPIMSSGNWTLPWTGGERRGLLRAVVDVDGASLGVYVTHLSLDDRENELQRAEIAEILRRSDLPFVLLGDMNVPWEHHTLPLFGDSATDAWLQAIELAPDESPLRRLTTLGSTFSSSRPAQRIDYIFVSDELQATGEGGVYTLQSLASDHLPLVADLHWKH